jgi:hypothetical protein
VTFVQLNRVEIARIGGDCRLGFTNQAKDADMAKAEIL